MKVTMDHREDTVSKREGSIETCSNSLQGEQAGGWQHRKAMGLQGAVGPTHISGAPPFGMAFQKD